MGIAASDIVTTTVTALTRQNTGVAFEKVAAVLQPFDAMNYTGNHPLAPIAATGGLLFPFNPSIREGIAVNYDAMKITHSNEAYHIYQHTENTTIDIADAVWTADTFQNAVYALSVIHFFRSHTMMDFGRGRSGKPPSPFWFSAYGNYAYWKVPVLLKNVSFEFPKLDDMDYVGIPEPGTAAWNDCSLKQGSPSNGDQHTWIPIKFTVSTISLVVQHTPRYWIGFNLDQYRSGEMLKLNGSFHKTSSAALPSPRPATVTTPTTPTPPGSPTTTPTPPPPPSAPPGSRTIP